MSTPQNLHEELAQTHDYITALEGAILHICEGLDIDPEALVEDLQTPERAKEMRKRIASTRNRLSTAQDSARLHSVHKHAPVYKKQYSSAMKRVSAHGSKLKSIQNQNKAERKDRKTVYGKGGKVVGKAKPAK